MLGGRSTDLLEELVHLGRIGAANPFPSQSQARPEPFWNWRAPCSKSLFMPDSRLHVLPALL